MESILKSHRKNMDMFVRYADGAEMYHVSILTFMQWAKKAKACYGIIIVPAKRIEQIAQLLDTSSGYLLSGEISRENKDKHLNQINLWYENLEDDSDRQFVFEQVELAIRWISKKEKECKW